MKVFRVAVDSSCLIGLATNRDIWTIERGVC